MGQQILGNTLENPSVENVFKDLVKFSAEDQEDEELREL